jgi:hypothetical protein
MFNLLFLCVVQTQIKAIMNTQSPTDRVCSEGSIYWSPNDACGQVLGKEHSGRVRGVGLGPTPGKSTSYTSGQRSVSSGPSAREAAMAIEMEGLKSLYGIASARGGNPEKFGTYAYAGETTFHGKQPRR